MSLTESFILFYNKEIFDRVGIENPPETLEEMVEDAKLITSELAGEGIYGFAENMKSASSGLNRSMIVGLQSETGAPMGYDFEKGEYDFTTWADELKLWTELLSDECAFPGCESLDIDPLRTQFAAGKIGMYMSYSHAEPGVYANQFPMDSDKWDCAPIPTVGGKKLGKQYFSGTSGYLLNAKSENLEKAYQVYHDIFTTEDMEKLKKRFPEASCIMLGRGILRNPELIEIMKSGEKKIDAKKLRAFHDQIYQDYQEVSCGDKNVLFKMKELWCYLGTLFPDKEKQLKKIRKAEKLDRYEAVVEELLSHNYIDLK